MKLANKLPNDSSGRRGFSFGMLVTNRVQSPSNGLRTPRDPLTTAVKSRRLYNFHLAY